MCQVRSLRFSPKFAILTKNVIKLASVPLAVLVVSPGGAHQGVCVPVHGPHQALVLVINKDLTYPLPFTH